MNLPKQDSATGRGLKTAFQAFAGTIITFLIGLWLAIKGVPGCDKAVLDFLQPYVIYLAGGIGISSGTISFFMNFFRKNVANY